MSKLSRTHLLLSFHDEYATIDIKYFETLILNFIFDCFLILDQHLVHMKQHAICCMVKDINTFVLIKIFLNSCDDTDWHAEDQCPCLAMLKIAKDRFRQVENNNYSLLMQRKTWTAGQRWCAASCQHESVIVIVGITLSRYLCISATSKQDNGQH